MGQIRRRNWHTCVLKECPRFDWDKLLTTEQKQQRDQVGFLFGNGGLDQQLKPLEECPTL